MSRTILLIEDNEQNRYLATFLLESQGYHVVPAADGPQGLQIAESLQPWLILLDIQLPKLDGYAVAGALRQMAALKHTPIIAVTSYAMPGDREKALATGCNGYIEKPIDPDTFVQAIEACATAWHAAQEQPPQQTSSALPPADSPTPPAHEPSPDR